MSRELNSIGVPQLYGPRTSDAGLPSGILEDGPLRRLVLDFTYTQAAAGIPTLAAEDDAAVLRVPQGAIIKSAHVFVTAAWTSANNPTLNIGFQGVDGSTVDADGIAALQKAALVSGAVLVAAGADINTVPSTTDVQISVDVVNDTTGFTAGAARLVVEYLPYNV